MADALKAAHQTLSDAMRMNNMRIQVGTENFVNAKSTGATPGSDPYTRKTLTFQSAYDKITGAETVKLDHVGRDTSAYKLEHLPEHPAADEKGMVKFPNVTSAIELADVQQASIAQKTVLQMYKLVTNVDHDINNLIDITH